MRCEKLTFLCVWLCFSVERDRLREREKQARAQMSSLVAERDLEHQDGGGAPLFGAPVKVSLFIIINVKRETPLLECGDISS